MSEKATVRLVTEEADRRPGQAAATDAIFTLCTRMIALGLDHNAALGALMSAWLGIAYHADVAAEDATQSLHDMARLVPRSYAHIAFLAEPMKGRA